MKKQRLLTIALLSAVFSLAACQPTVSPATSSADTGDATTSEASSTVTHSMGDADWIDYAHNGSAKLKLDYKGHDFFTDGVGQVTLKTKIDGDTTHFYGGTSGNKSEDNVIAARYLGINTPEATGHIEEWGRAASNFTNEHIDNAAKNGTIVLSSTLTEYGAPSKDSNDRYLCCIWINETEKNCDYKDLTLLNLWIVQNGYSNANAMDEPGIAQYSDVFWNAALQAKAYGLHIWSNEPDPDFNYGGYEDISLLDVKREIEAQIADPTHTNKYDNAKARIRGVVAGYSNSVLYLTNFYPADDTYAEGAAKPKYADGEYAGINIYTGPSAIPDKFTKMNSLIEICGTFVDSETFGFQMSGVSLPRVQISDTDGKVVYTPDQIPNELKVHEFSMTSTEFINTVKNKDYPFLNCRVSFTDALTCTGGYDGKNGMTLYFGTNLSAYLAFTYSPDGGTTTYRSYTDFVNKSFKLSGVAGVHKTTSNVYRFQILPNSAADLVLQEAA